ncbi:unnamed protein product [Discula destructiva]
MDANILPAMLNLSQLPVPPAPDHRTLFQHPVIQTPTLSLTNPVLFRHFARRMEAPMLKKKSSLLDKHYQEQQQLRKQETARPRPEPTQAHKLTQATLPAQCCSTPSTSASTLASSSSEPSSAETKVAPQSSPPAPHLSQTQGQTQTQPPHSTKPAPIPGPGPAPEPPFLGQNGLSLFDTSHTTDPKYAQMVSRMAAYYQQRCQAILNFQQQRCQSWATAHRQKCQESVQAAMLVVAWYIRDRIGRRKRRNKRAFRRGLREKNYQASALPRRGRGGGGGGGGRVGGSKASQNVRKWVMGIPDEATATMMLMSSGNGALDDDDDDMRRLDKEEREFDVDKEAPKDKESQLFAVADQMIKSQLAKIDVPLLGALNLDDSDRESDSEDDASYDLTDYDMEDEDDDDDDEEEEGEEEYEYDEYEDDLDYEEESAAYVEDGVSKEALNGTGKGSLKRKRSETTD